MCSILRGHLCHPFLAQVGPLLGHPRLLFQPCLIQLCPTLSSTKPFVLKMKTNQIRVCQSCREDYNGLDDTMGLFVAGGKRRLVSNLTGTEYLGHESNSSLSFTHGVPACSAFMKWRASSLPSKRFTWSLAFKYPSSHLELESYNSVVIFRPHCSHIHSLPIQLGSWIFIS